VPNHGSVWAMFTLAFAVSLVTLVPPLSKLVGSGMFEFAFSVDPSVGR
jgi:hypothetical protein